MDFYRETLSIENRQRLQYSRLWSTAKTVLCTPIFIINATCSALAYSCVILYMVVTPFLYQHVLGLSAIEYGWLSIFNAGAISIGSFINGGLVMRLGTKCMLRSGIYLLLAGAIAMLILFYLGQVKLLLILLPMLFVFSGVAFISANTMAGAIEPFAKTAGIASALYGVFIVLMSGLVSFIAQLLYEKTQLPLALALLLIAIIIFLIHHWGRG